MLPVDPARFTLYLSGLLAFVVAPGPANLFSIATGMRAGHAAALRGVIGLNVGSLVWFIATALGLHALITAFPGVFRAMAIVGGGYIGWLGFKALLAAWRGSEAATLAGVRSASRESAFRDGLIVQIANPKAVVFFTAYLPPFIDPSRPIGGQLVWFGAAAITMDAVAMTAYGLAGGALLQRLETPQARRLFSTTIGALLVTVAVLILTRA